MKRTVLNTSTFKGFVSEKMETYVIDLMDEDELPEDLKKEYDSVSLTYRVFTYPTALIASPDSEREKGRLVGFDRRGPTLYVEKLEELMGKL